MKTTDETSKIPRTGRIGRFAKIVENETSESSFLKVMSKSEEYGEYKPKQKALWWNNSMEVLEKELGTEKAPKPFKSEIYCQCSVEFNKQFF